MLAGRIAGWCAATALAFVLVTAVIAAHSSGWFSRWSLTLLVLFAAPIALLRVPWVRRRPDVLTAYSLVVVVALVAAGGRTVGGTVRRHGDWFLGDRTDGRARFMRGAVGVTGALFEWFTVPEAMKSHELPPELAPRFYGPWRDGETPYDPEPMHVRWIHPLAEAQRNLPACESRRFGAVRPQPRPWECELGHCGVDLAAPMGEPVYAVADGVVERVERNPGAGGRAGRYVRIGHLGGAVVTRYIHLDTIRKELHAGRRVVAGELLGTVGRTGVVENFPHLHFGLSLRTSGRELYVDPEPFLRVWDLPSADSPGVHLPPAMIALR